MTLLLDIGSVPERHCDACLDHLAKAVAEDPGGDPDGIWARHPDPWLAEHVEDATKRFQAMLQHMQDMLSRLLFGEVLGDLAKAESWTRWDQAEIEAVRARLRDKPTSSYTIDDWMTVVDLLLQTYMPADAVVTEAEYLTVRAALLGKVSANLAGNTPPSHAWADTIAAYVPTQFAAVPPRVLSPRELSVLYVAKARAAVNISDVKEEARRGMKSICIAHVQAMLLGERDGQGEALRQALFDEFGRLNRDFRRIAVTEAGECMLQGFIAAQDPGQRVQRQEAYRGACDFCRSINGQVFEVVDPAAPRKDGERQVWLGKTNVGRSASPRRRVGDQLMERTANERWWPAAGVQHPHCRGSWRSVTQRPAAVSQEFADWLDAKIAAVAPVAAQTKEAP